MAANLLAVVHPWTAVKGQADAPSLTEAERQALVDAAFPLFINARILRDLNGVVVFVPPDGFVVSTLTPPAIMGDIMRLDLHTTLSDDMYRANVLCDFVPTSTRPQATSPVFLLYAENDEAILGGAFDLRRHRKGVPYRNGTSGSARPSAAASVLPQGAWICRVGV